MWHPPIFSRSVLPPTNLKLENGHSISSDGDQFDVPRVQGDVIGTISKVTDGGMITEASAADAKRSLVENGTNGSLNVTEGLSPFTDQSVTSEWIVDNQYPAIGASPMEFTIDGNLYGTMLLPRVKFYEHGSTSSTATTIKTNVGCSAMRDGFVSHKNNFRIDRRHPIFKRSEAPRHPIFKRSEALRHPIFKRSEARRHPRGCLFCKDTKHSAQHCTVYPDVHSRIEFLDENQLCHGCAFKRHEMKKCPIYNKKKCKICGGKNHILAICRRQQGLTEHTTTGSSHEKKTSTARSETECVKTTRW